MYFQKEKTYFLIPLFSLLGSDGGPKYFSASSENAVPRILSGIAAVTFALAGSEFTLERTFVSEGTAILCDIELTLATLSWLGILPKIIWGTELVTTGIFCKNEDTFEVVGKETFLGTFCGRKGSADINKDGAENVGTGIGGSADFLWLKFCGLTLAGNVMYSDGFDASKLTIL